MGGVTCGWKCLRNIIWLGSLGRDGLACSPAAHLPRQEEILSLRRFVPERQTFHTRSHSADVEVVQASRSGHCSCRLHRAQLILMSRVTCTARFLCKQLTYWRLRRTPCLRAVAFIPWLPWRRLSKRDDTHLKSFRTRWKNFVRGFHRQHTEFWPDAVRLIVTPVMLK